MWNPQRLSADAAAVRPGLGNPRLIRLGRPAEPEQISADKRERDEACC